MTTLISFLGKGQKDGYREANYRFDQTSIHRGVRFFGMSLAEHVKPDRMILIGTPGSMWDVFFERESAEHDETLLALIEAVAEGRVSAEQLKASAEHLSRERGIPVNCLLIDAARDARSQVRILEQLSSELQEGEHIVIDVTHSYRHLPMLALVAARFLKRTRKVQTESIYYGALEMTSEGEAPVIRLDGLLDMLDWVDALSSYDENGDYGAFAPLYERAGQNEAAEFLAQAAFFERTNQTGQARRPLRAFRSIEPTRESAMVTLFYPEVQRRTAWAEEQTYHLRQEQMARHHLHAGDYLRAATLGFEAFISHLAAGYGDDPMNHDKRGKAKEEFDIQLKRAGRKKSDLQIAYLGLRDLRNALAHGNRSDNGDIQVALSSEERLRDFITARFDVLHAPETVPTR